MQLCGLLSRWPHQAPHYAPALQQMLVWGCAEDPNQSGVVRARAVPDCLLVSAFELVLDDGLPCECLPPCPCSHLHAAPAVPAPAAPQGDPADAESAAELAALLAPGDAQLAAAFAACELAPRVAALCMLRVWVEAAQPQGFLARAPEQQQEEEQQPQAAEEARAAGLLMWRRLQELAASDPEMSMSRYSPLGPVHRKKVRGE